MGRFLEAEVLILISGFIKVHIAILTVCSWSIVTLKLIDGYYEINLLFSTTLKLKVIRNSHIEQQENNHFQIPH